MNSEEQGGEPLQGAPGVAPPDVFFADTEFFREWQPSVAEANAGKRGAPFAYPAAFFEWLACVRVRTGMDYRSLGLFAEGLLAEVRKRLTAQRASPELIARLTAPHFTQLRRRLNEVRMGIDLARSLVLAPPRYILLARDGVLVTDYRGWIYKSGQQLSRGWVRAELPGAVALGGSVTAAPVAPEAARRPWER